MLQCFQMLQMLQDLKNVANVANFQKKRKRKKKHAYVAGTTERTELSNFCSALKCCGYCRVFKKFENVAETFFKTLLQCCGSYNLLRMSQSFL